MTITLNADYDVTLNTALLGYVGETNARPVSVEGMEIDGADRYVLTIDYGDGTVYEVDITGGQWTPTADILRSAQTVSCQICAKKLSGQEYILLKKSRIFRLRIGAAIGDNAVPSPSVAADALDKIDAIGTQVAADRKAAETAAQTAQSIADSLPDDYVTAVGKIAENTAEIANVKLTDKELKRRVNALYDMGNGVTHRFETDSETAYQKTVPTGAKLMSVKSVGGKSIVWNQIFEAYNGTNNGVTVATESDGTITLNGTAESSYVYFKSLSPAQDKVGKYILKLLILNNPDSVTMRYAYFNRTISTPTATKGTAAALVNQTAKDIELQKVAGLSGFTTGTVFNDVKIKIQIFDLTVMFGSGNEPTSVEEFEAMFPNDYYQYNAGEIVSAGTESIVEQGKNLFNKSGKENSDAYTIPMYYNGRYKGLKIPCENGDYIISTKHKSGYVSGMSKSVYVFDSEIRTDNNITGLIIEHLTGYGYNVDKTGIISVKHGYIILSVFSGESTSTDRKSFFDLCDIQIEKSSTATAYAPYHRNEYPIPEAIRALPGYGWSAGTARNYVDYENKKYVQCVNSVDLGTKNWRMYKDGDYTPFFYLNAVSDIRGGTSNFLCPKYQYVKIGVTDSASGLYVLENTTVRVRDTAYTDATAFKQAMSGVMLYYELANPIVTDISALIPDDFLRNLTVEAGGSVTFKNSNDNYHIPVPSEEEYIVKLSEVGGSV